MQGSIHWDNEFRVRELQKWEDNRGAHPNGTTFLKIALNFHYFLEREWSWEYVMIYAQLGERTII